MYLIYKYIFKSNLLINVGFLTLSTHCKIRHLSQVIDNEFNLIDFK